MTFKHMLLSTAAASGIMLTVAAAGPAGFSWVPKAEAATNISVNINIGTFYDDLAPYGDWVWYHGRYVWIPEDVDAHWRPYTEGHWVYTRRYGWMWVSEEDFGWACYHYGRWGFGRDVGWYWLPGRIWGPAWVAFSYDDDDFAWAPLPPDYYDDVSIVVSFGHIPDYYWQAAPFSAFLSVDLSDHVYRDRDRVHRVIQNSEPQTVKIENNIVVNNVIAVDDVEKKTKKKVAVLEERAVDNPDAAGKADSNSVAIFNPEVKEEISAKPRKIKNVDEVVTERKKKGIPEEPGQASTTIEEPVTKLKKKDTDTVTPQEEQQNAEQPATKKKKKTPVSTDQQNVDETVNVPAEEQAAPVGKKKKKKVDQQNVDETVNAPAEEQTAPVGNKKKKKVDQQNVDETVNAPAEEQTAPADNKKNKGGKKGQAECDPAVQECPPAE